MEYLFRYFKELVDLLFEMSPWLLLGFLIAGLLHVFFPEGKINKLLGKANMLSVLKAALIGIPLPLCSCGVIPTGVSIHKNGASKGAAVSFLISTPQTGVDSIMVTYSLLGLPFAVVRPIIALITGIFGGFFTNRAENKEAPSFTLDLGKDNNSSIRNKKKSGNPLLEIFKYAFVDFLQDIAKWLIIGLLIAGAIAVIVPDDFFASYVHNDFVGMLIILAASVPVYVCATSSVPIAAVLLMKGLSPGAALVFLMAGPATNAATISVIGNSLGRKTLFTYLGTLIIGALLSGLFVDYLLPREWFTLAIEHHEHQHEILPRWIHITSGILTAIFLLNIYLRKYIKKIKAKKQKIVTEMGDIKVFVHGMNCNHCKMNVENNLRKLDGIQGVEVDLDMEQVTLKGENIDLSKVKETVESIGYKYEEIKY